MLWEGQALNTSMLCIILIVDTFEYMWIGYEYCTQARESCGAILTIDDIIVFRMATQKACEGSKTGKVSPRNTTGRHNSLLT